MILYRTIGRAYLNDSTRTASRMCEEGKKAMGEDRVAHTKVHDST